MPNGFVGLFFGEDELGRRLIHDGYVLLLLVLIRVLRRLLQRLQGGILRVLQRNDRG